MNGTEKQNETSMEIPAEDSRVTMGNQTEKKHRFHLKMPQKGRKHSVKKRIAYTFIATMAATLLIIGLINYFFLGSFYIRDKEHILAESFQKLNATGGDSDNIPDTFEQFCATNNLKVIITGPELSSFVYSNATDRQSLQTLIFGLIISVLLSFLLSKTLTTPIERLTEGAERVADGDFSHKIEVASRDEIGVLTGTFNDMAQQLKRTLEEVENERTKLGTLFLHMTDGVVAFSRDGTVIQSNPAAEQMLGRAIPIGGGESYDTLFSDVAPLQGVLAVEQPGYLDGEREVDGRSLELLLTPFDQERLGGVLVVIHDVTEQRKTEEMRREFVANVSHELRTPLTNIRSYAETLADNAGDIPPETEKNFLGVILNESDRMTHIVQDLLTLSRFDSGRSELNLAPFDFGEAVRDVYQANRLEAQRHGHTMELELPGSLPEIVGDRERILQVMMNVVSNSIKYTPDGGRIRLSAGVQGKRVWMEVTDNGIGIPKEDRGRIFERFYRVDKARSRESGGTGLGLSIAKEIIDRHQGTIELVDRPGPGLTVRITLLVEGPGHGWK